MTGAVLVTQLIAPAPAQAAAGDISTVAGGLGIGTATSLGMSARGLAVSGTSLYVADQDANLIRKVNLTDGSTSVVGGTGVLATSGDGGQATAAALQKPTDVAVDSAGNVYVAAWFDNRVRKITVSTGVITTIAGTGVQGFTGNGGQATAATLDQPRAVAVNSTGEVFIGEIGNNVVRKVATNGVISTFASGFGQVRNIAVDSSNRVYVTDCSGNRVYRYPAGGGAATTIAGTGAADSTGDGGLATAATLGCPIGIAVDSSDNVYVAENNSNRIRKITAADGKIDNFGGSPGSAAGLSGDGGPATAALLDLPTDIDLDAGGNLYVAQRNNFGATSTTTTSAIRKIDTGGVISTVAGNTWSGFSGDGGAATSAQLANPSAVTTDSADALYIADTANNRIRKVASGIITTVAGTGLPCTGACGVTDIGDGAAATGGNLSGPQGVTVTTAGDLYIADTLHHRIRRVSGGTITTVAGTGTAGYSGDGGTATSAAINSPQGLYAAANGNLYFADRGNNRIRMISGTTITTVAGTGTAAYTGDGASATAATLNAPGDVRVDTAGNIYIADTGNNVVRVVTASTGKISTFAGTGASGASGDGGDARNARLNAPAGLEDDADGNIYVADTGNNRVRRIDRHGVVNTIAGTGATATGGDGSAGATAPIAAPGRIAVDTAGNVYIAGSGEMRIRKLSVQTGAATWWTSDSTTGHTDSTYAWEFVTQSTTAFKSITFTVPSVTNTTATGLFLSNTVGMATTGTLTLSAGVLTYTLAAAEVPRVGEHYYLAVTGFTNSASAGGYSSTVTTRTATPATIEVSVSGTIDLTPSGNPVLPNPKPKATITPTATFKLVMDPLIRADAAGPFTATIVTSATYGYQLSLKGTALTGGGLTIPPVSTNIADAVNTSFFGTNRFGYRVSAITGSAAGAAQPGIGGTSLAGFTTTGETVVVAAKGTSTTGDVVAVSSRVKLDYLQPAGVYTSTVTWTLTPLY